VYVLFDEVSLLLPHEHVIAFLLDDVVVSVLVPVICCALPVAVLLQLHLLVTPGQLVHSFFSFTIPSLLEVGGHAMVRVLLFVTVGVGAYFGPKVIAEITFTDVR